MTNLVRRYWDTNPLVIIISLAMLFRLLAVIFAKGWGMLDDHFVVIESSGSWSQQPGYNSWLPGAAGNHGPTGHNLFYPGLHYLLFTFLNWIGVTSPQGKMYVVRLLHAALSMITIYCGYRIAEQLEGKKSAKLAGLLLAVFWFMPWMSVRNLVEMACVPFIMSGYWLILRRTPDKRIFRDWLLAGLLFGIAVNIRPQAVFFPLGIGLVILFQRKWIELFSLTIGSLFCFSLFQGGIDFFIWGKPFAELLEYVNVCVTERNDYIALPWYNYFLTIFALMIPPVSLFLFYGFVKNWKKYLIVFIPMLLFFIFHSSFPNKQERFILPMIPLMIVFGAIGWTQLTENSGFLKKHPGFSIWSWGIFWFFNTILLLVFTFSYSKKARVEAMTYLSRYQDISAIVVVDEDSNPELMPKFYLNQWPVSYNEYAGDLSADSVLAVAYQWRDKNPPRFILFTGDKRIQPMVITARKYFPRLVYETTIESGFLDRFVHWLNPINKNRRIFIYRNSAVIPQRIEK